MHPSGTVNEDVRWMRPKVERSWHYGKLVSLVADTVEISALRGGRYTVARESVEIKRRGPRGGIKWEKL